VSVIRELATELDRAMKHFFEAQSDQEIEVMGQAARDARLALAACQANTLTDIKIKAVALLNVERQMSLEAEFADVSYHQLIISQLSDLERFPV
jgi:hypothetical protein